MKTISLRILLISILLSLFLLHGSFQRVYAQEATETLQSPTNTSQASTDRPLVVVSAYYLDQDTIQPGQSFRLFLSVKNEGAVDAYNLIFNYSGSDFLPQETGGVVALTSLGPGQTVDFSQKMLATTGLWGRTSGSVTVQLSYNGPSGEAYSESFSITLDVLGWSGNYATATPTPTATSLPRAQLVVSSYSSDIDPLQPGTMFNLKLDIQNLGSGDARGVTMILGGGTYGTTSVDSTPQPGGVSGSGAELSTFAPIGSSNLQFLGDINSGTTRQVSHNLIVNVSANPGAYTLKMSFVYSDTQGNRLVDDQIITLLVYQLPQLEVGFYRDPGVITAMAPNTLPIQVTNLGRKSAIMGNMTVTAENADLMNNVSLVGTLDAGGYFPLDVMLIPNAAGPLDIQVTISYTDDFNVSRTIVQSLHVDATEAPPMEDPGFEPGTEGAAPIEIPMTDETTWQKVLRFLKGMIGLDSSVPQTAPVIPEEMPGEEIPPSDIQPVPGGKG